MRPRYLVLVCQNVRSATDPRGACALRGSGEVIERLRSVRQERGLKSLFRATSTGCLGGCAHGPTVVVARTDEPHAGGAVAVYSGVRPEDVDELVEQHLLGGRPLERRLADPEWFD